MSRTALAAFGATWLLLLVSGAGAAPGLLRLSEVADGAEFMGWNQSGTQLLSLPRGWGVTAGSDQTVRVQLAEGEELTLPAGTWLRGAVVLRAMVRSPFVRGRHLRGGLNLSLTTRHLEFQGGAPFQCPIEEFGARRQAVVTAVDLSKPLVIETGAKGDVSLSLDRVQWSSPSAREAAIVDGEELPGLADDQRPEAVVTFGLWSPEGLRLIAGGGRLEAETARLGWGQINGRDLSLGPPKLDVPHAELWLRQATFRRTARRRLPCRLSEPTGLLAQGVKLTLSGAPTVVQWSLADSPAGLYKGLEHLDRARTGGAGGDPLVAILQDDILPSWYGLWYDAVAAREEVRDAPTLDVFVASYRSAVAASRPKLLSAMDALMARTGQVTLADAAGFTGLLSQIIDQAAGSDRRAAMWYSVYVSDVLSDLAQRPILYHHLEQRLDGVAANPAKLSVAAVRERVARKGDAGVVRTLLSAPVTDESADELSFPRLDPSIEVPIDMLVEVGRSTPVGTYQVEATVAAAGAEPAKVAMVVHVQPGYGRMCLVALCWLVPPGVVLLLLASALARRRAGGDGR